MDRRGWVRLIRRQADRASNLLPQVQIYRRLIRQVMPQIQFGLLLIIFK